MIDITINGLAPELVPPGAALRYFGYRLDDRLCLRRQCLFVQHNRLILTFLASLPCCLLVSPNTRSALVCLYLADNVCLYKWCSVHVK